MNQTTSQPTSSTWPSSEIWQRLQRRIVIQLVVVLLATVLISGAGILYFVFFTNQKDWLLFGGGLLLLIASAVWITARILKQTIVQPLEALQAHLNREIGQVGQMTETFGQDLPEPPAGADLGPGETATPSGQTEILYELQKIKTEIEAKVQESTTELREANEQLRLELLERKQIESDLIERNREMMILQSAILAITSRLDLRYVLDTVAQEMVKLLEVEICAIYEWDQTEDTISRMAKYSPSGWWDPTSRLELFHLSEYPLTKEVLEEQIPQQMTVSQPYLDPAEAAYMQQTQVKSRMIVPMISKREVIGLVELADSRVERKFSHQEITLAKLLANQAATAIENARLYDRAQEEIDERQRAEEALKEERALLAQRVEERTLELSQANVELVRASRLKDEFLAGMSHELRTPLNAILGSAEILQMEVFGPLSEKQLKFSKTIEESGGHLLSLINDILDLSKVEAGKVELEIRPVSVDSICQASMRLVKQQAHKKELQLSYNLDDSVRMISADERRLKQILVNLLSNAVKFTPEGGKVGLEVTGNAEAEVIHFTVWDTGIGISQEDMPRLFQPFVQLDSDLSRKYTGTGLGLSLVSRMTELHGGSVSVKSEPGQGSRFIISLPWSAPFEPEETEVELDELDRPAGLIDQNVEREQPLILLADDHEENIKTIFDYLELQGYRLVLAQNGAEAIDRARAEKPDLILMDVQMPGVDGLEATRRLRADSHLAEVPVIALTALAMPGDKERCLAAGANEYLSKPVSLKKLVKIVETYLDRRRIPKGDIT